jgi:pimeloyl-ACP methyl ester carboxylesterase
MMQNTNTKPAIVLIHGAWADATGWQHVIPELLDAGYEVSAAQLPENSMDNDIATAQRVIDAQKGDVVLVGHSYGGAVITGAASDRKNVKALVYIAAFAPDAGETLEQVNGMFAPTQLLTSLVPDAAGFVSIDRSKFKEIFAQDVNRMEAQIMAITQKPIFAGILKEPMKAAAWKTIPSWYLVSAEDRVINPELERFFAKRMNAQTSEVQASHVSFISQPHETTRIILDAAQAIAEGKTKEMVAPPA